MKKLVKMMKQVKMIKLVIVNFRGGVCMGHWGVKVLGYQQTLVSLRLPRIGVSHRLPR
jgi:hypothetical protein